MRRVTLFLSSVALILGFLAFGRVYARQVSQESPGVPQNSNPKASSLKVCLRLEGDAPFGGVMRIRLLPGEGDDINGAPTGSEGETIFGNLQPGTYFLEASAPGFVTIRRNVQIDAGHGLQTLFVTMKPRLLAAHLSEVSSPPPAPTPPAVPVSWSPPSLDDSVPEVDASVECPLPDLLRMTGERMKDFVGNLEKFSATERVEHFKFDAAGERGSADVRSFEYIVFVSPGLNGFFYLDEYRNGSVDPAQFPAQIATTGLPAMALIFHPNLASDFNFKCEGLGRWEGRPAWQVHFAQRADRPNRIRQYVINKNFYPVPLKGRAWVDPGTNQVVRLESELSKPVEQIELTKEHLSIEYGPVDFHSHGQQLWLPQVAELYVERKGRRYFRRHTFTNFKLFTVETAQIIAPPKESYVFTNTSVRDIVGMLTVTPVSGSTLQSVSITFGIPAGKTVFKSVGSGKDVGIPVEFVGAATFSYDGPEDSVNVNAYLTNDSSVDVTANAHISQLPRASAKN